jgi:hypothetical protein
MLRWLSPIGGGALALVALADIFLTVLYARIGWAFLIETLGACLWRLFKRVAPGFGRYRDQVLSFCGPTVLVCAVALWVTMLICGFALIVWPRLGTSVVASRPDQPTPRDFATAIYYSGSCLTTAFNGDLVPRTAFFRLLVPVESAIGISVLTLSLTYFLEVYNALLRRSTLAQNLQHATGGTGDAAEWVAGLGPAGDFSQARGELFALGTEMLNFLESQHLYPILIYFRFGEARYAIARKTLIVFDAVSLIRTALDGERYASFIASAAVNGLWNGGMQLMRMMGANFLGGASGGEEDLDAETAARWHRRFRAAAERFRAAGIATAPDEDAAAERYTALRRQWQCYVDGFTRFMQRSREEIEPPDADPA